MVLVCSFLMADDLDHLPMCLCHQYSHFGEMSLFLFPILCLLLRFESSVQTLDTSPLSDMRYEIIFFQLSPYFCILLAEFFPEPSFFFFLMKSDLSIFPVKDCTFGVNPKS